MFRILIKNQEVSEVLSEKEISSEVSKALSLMFESYSYYDFNVKQEKYALHIHTNDSEEFRELISLYGKAFKSNPELMKNIAINLDK